MLPTLACVFIFTSPPCPTRAPLSRRARDHGIGNFRTAALAALVVRNHLHCRFRVFCRVSRTCARTDIFAVASSRRRGGSTTRRSRSRGCPRALDRRSSSCSASSERRSRLWFVIATTPSGERCRSVDGLWSSTRNRSLTHWEAQTAHRLHDEHPFMSIPCELRSSDDGRCLILARA